MIFTTSLTRHALLGLVVLGCLTLLGPPRAHAEDGLLTRVQALENRVAELESELQQMRAQQANERLLSQLSGEWKERLCIEQGKKLPAEDEVLWILRPDDSTRTVLAAEVSREDFGKLTIDATKDPAWITFHGTNVKGEKRVWPGLVSVTHLSEHGHPRRAIITIALPRSTVVGFTGAERPTTLQSTEKNGVMLFELEPIK